jgi:integrase
MLGLVGLRAVHSGLGLRWEDVDLEARTLKVRRQLQRSRGGSGLIVVPTKIDKCRVIRLGPAIVETLKVHREIARTRR